MGPLEHFLFTYHFYLFFVKFASFLFLFPLTLLPFGGVN